MLTCFTSLALKWNLYCFLSMPHENLKFLNCIHVWRSKRYCFPKGPEGNKDNKMQEEVKKLMGKRCSCVWPIDPSCLLPSDDIISPKPSKREPRKKSRPELSRSSECPPLVLTEKQRGSILGKIFVSNAAAAKDSALLKALEVSAVISVGGGKHAAALIQDGFHVGEYCGGINDAGILENACEFARPILADGRNVLIHCRGGMHRSPVVAAGLLIGLGGLSTDQAVCCIQSGRPSADFDSPRGLLLKEQLDLFEHKKGH